MKSFKLRNTIISNHGRIGKYIFYGYRSIPFLFELKNFLDWTITTTSLNLVQWIKLEEIHAHLFLCKGTAEKFKRKKHGKAVSVIKKILLGGCSVLFILVLLFGPMIFFSDLNPSSKTNFVTGCQVEFGLVINSENYYKFYSNSLVSKIEIVDDTTFQQYFKNVNYFQTIDRNMFQMIEMQENSESNWNLTEPSYQDIVNSLNRTINGIENSSFSIKMSYLFEREVCDDIYFYSYYFY